MMKSLQDPYEINEKELEEMIGPEKSHRLMASIRSQNTLGEAALRCSIFTVDIHDVNQAISGDAPEELELPPLPFPQILVEADTEESWTVTGDEKGNGNRVEFYVEAIAIQEVDQGELWYVVYFISGDTPIITTPWGRSLSDFQAVPAFLTRKGVSFETSDEGVVEIPHGPGRDPFHALPVEMVHYIDARGVTVLPCPTYTRQIRRNLERKYRVSAPKIYWVRVDDKYVDESPGRGERTYHCRWLVRGHWRRKKEGKTWVRPHIKGPAGAPWKGRPVYQVVPRGDN